MEYFWILVILTIAIVWVISSAKDIIKCYNARATYSRKWWKELKETTQFLFVFIIFVLVCISMYKFGKLIE